MLDPLAAHLVLADVSGASAMRTRAFSRGDERPRNLAPPPALSEHAYPVLSDLLGYPDDRIRRLARAGGVLMGGSGDPE